MNQAELKGKMPMTRGSTKEAKCARKSVGTKSLSLPSEEAAILDTSEESDGSGGDTSTSDDDPTSSSE